MEHHNMTAMPVQNALSSSALLLVQRDSILDNESGNDFTHQSSLASDHDSAGQDSFQRGLDAELDRELEEMIRQTSLEIDDEIQQHIDDQLNAQFEVYIDDYFRMTQHNEERQVLLDLSKEKNKATFKAYDIPVISAIDSHGSHKEKTTITDLNAQIQQVIDQFNQIT